MQEQERDLEDEVTNTDGSLLAGIKVGLMNRGGEIIDIIPLKQLVMTGQSVTLELHNYGHRGEVIFELVLPAHVAREINIHATSPIDRERNEQRYRIEKNPHQEHSS